MMQPTAPGAAETASAAPVDARAAQLAEIETDVIEGLPRLVRMRLVRADGATFECVMRAEGAHRASDDLLRAAAHAARRARSVGQEPG